MSKRQPFRSRPSVRKKRITKHKEPPCGDTSSRPNAVQQLDPPATTASLAIDSAAAVAVTLINQTACQIPTGVTRAIYASDSALAALLTGKSSAGLAGLIVLPGVIDADYTGEIQVRAYTLSPPLPISKATRIAQLILYLTIPT